MGAAFNKDETVEAKTCDDVVSMMTKSVQRTAGASIWRHVPGNVRCLRGPTCRLLNGKYATLRNLTQYAQSKSCPFPCHGIHSVLTQARNRIVDASRGTR